MIKPSKKNILIFHPYLAPYRIDLYNRLSEDFNLHVLLTGKQKEIDTLAFDLKNINSKSRFNFCYYSKGLYLGRHLISFIYYKEFKRFKPDIVLTHELGFNTFFSLLAKSKFSFKQFTTIDDSPNMIQKQSILRGFLQKTVVRHIDGMLVVNPKVQRNLYKLYNYYQKDKFHYLPIVQDDKCFIKNICESKGLPTHLMDKYKLYDKKIILYVGRLEEIKCPDLLLKAFSKINNKDCFLVIIGGGSLHSQLEKSINNSIFKNNILLTGKLSGTSLYSWYNLAHIFVLPSKFEPFGAVVNEALIAGCFVIASDVVGSSCLINKNNGILFKNEDLVDLCEKLEYSLDKVPFKKIVQSKMEKSFNDYYEDLKEYINNEN